MTASPLLALPDYQRIYQVIYSVLEASEVAVTHRACMFFASAGALLLREHYGLQATISSGCMGLMVDEKAANVVVDGRKEGGEFVYDSEGFHAWNECDGWMIDFMAPIMGVALREDGKDIRVPRRMLQKRLVDGKSNLHAIQHLGEFYVAHDPSIAEALLDSQAALFGDLLHMCQTWFRKPPKPLKPLGMADNHGMTKQLVLRAPSIDGVW